MSAYKEFTGKSVEEALRGAREEFGVDLAELDFEILTPGSRGVLGMGAEPARIVAAPRSALGGAAPEARGRCIQPAAARAAPRGSRTSRRPRAAAGSRRPRTATRRAARVTIEDPAAAARPIATGARDATIAPPTSDRP